MDSESYFLQSAEKDELVSNCQTYAKHYEELEKINRDRRHSSIQSDPLSHAGVARMRGVGRDMVSSKHVPRSSMLHVPHVDVTIESSLTAVNETADSNHIKE